MKNESNEINFYLRWEESFEIIFFLNKMILTAFKFVIYFFKYLRLTVNLWYKHTNDATAITCRNKNVVYALASGSFANNNVYC